MAVQDNIVYLHTGLPGAAQVSGLAGALEAWLYQALVSGFNSDTCTITREGNVATVTRANHGFIAGPPAPGFTSGPPGTWVQISGADQPEYNGMFLPLSATTNTFTIQVSGAPASPATGAITCKFAPLGWTRPLTAGATKSLFRGDDHAAASTQFIVDDTGLLTAQGARNTYVFGLENYTDINTYGQRYPTAAQLQFGVLWRKSNALSNADRAAWIIGNGRFMHVGIAWSSNYPGRYSWYWCGDPISDLIGDPYPGVVAGHNSDDPVHPAHNLGTGIVGAYVTNVSVTGLFKARGYSKLGSAIGVGLVGQSAASNYFGNSSPLGAINPITQGYDACPIDLTDGSTPIGHLPGVYQPYQNVGLAHGDILPPAATFLTGKAVLVLGVQDPNLVVGGKAFFDLTGPWT